MSRAPVQLTLELTPKARLDVIDVRSRVAAAPEGLLQFPRCLYYSFHTTAGYLDQSLATRLSRRLGIQPYIAMFGAVFPERAGYRHDQLDHRTELSSEQREVEPQNADAHLAFIAAGLHTCVSYVNHRTDQVCFIDLDGVADGRPRQRRTSVIGYTSEVEVARVRLAVPVSGHPVDSVNLKDPRLGISEQLSELVARHGVTKGRISLRLAPNERHAGLTVNEYETLLMRHDLAQVLRDPLRFMAEKGRHMLADPRAIPQKTLGYAKYDLVRTLNQFFDALGLNESLVERVISRAIGVPAARFLRMKRSVSLLISDEDRRGRGTIVEGRYQSPILVQWRGADDRVRAVDIALTRFV
ncbi:MAG: hypothetical protein HYZ58_03445 [Acidobacteria bacterium]|nr:hypothetical protein [Acidobacteriota bacterium]